jgi:hypothetical protein
MRAARGKGGFMYALKVLVRYQYRGDGWLGLTKFDLVSRACRWSLLVGSGLRGEMGVAG